MGARCGDYSPRIESGLLIWAGGPVLKAPEPSRLNRGVRAAWAIHCFPPGPSESTGRNTPHACVVLNRFKGKPRGATGSEQAEQPVARWSVWQHCLYGTRATAWLPSSQTVTNSAAVDGLVARRLSVCPECIACFRPLSVGPDIIFPRPRTARRQQIVLTM